MGVTIDGKPAGEVMKELDSGRYAEIINKFEKLW
jgi:large subunit ribosomal protein L11